MNGKEILNDVYDMWSDANNKLIRIWLEQIVFSWQWWILILLSILPWIIWVKIHDKKHTVRLLFVGAIVGITTNTLDTIGLSFNLWHYDYKVFCFAPLYIPWDYTLFPVGVMFILQFKPKITAIRKAVAFAFFASFIFEPFFSWIDLYNPVHWKYYYSFIIYIPLYLFYDYIYKSRLFVERNG